MRLTLRPAESPAGIEDWQSNGNTDPSNAVVRKKAGAPARTGMLCQDKSAIKGGRYTDNAPAASMAPPANVTGFHPRFRTMVSLTNEPAAIPARYVASNRANAGARSKVARAKIRNQAISKPRAKNPATAASAAADRRPRRFPAPLPSPAPFPALCLASGGLLLPERNAVAPTTAFPQAARVTDPDWPKFRISIWAQKKHAKAD